VFDNDETSHIYLELQEPMSPNELAEILQKTGIAVRKGRAATPMVEGYALTLAAVEGIWDHESGAERYTPQCGQGCGHRNWYALTAEQQHTFLERYVRFLEACRDQTLDLADLLEDHPSFQDITLSSGHDNLE